MVNEKEELKLLMVEGRKFLLEQEDRGHTIDEETERVHPHVIVFRAALDRAANVIKQSVLVLFAVFMASTVHAWDQPRNPDRFISVGLKIENYEAGGAYTAISNPNGFALVERGHANEDSINLGANLRIPATESLTIDVDYMNIDGEALHNRNNNIYRDHAELKGYKASIGFRLYLNK